VRAADAGKRKERAVRTKMVKRYWCEFCGKASCSAGHMARHERHCTKNPNRECRVWVLLEKGQPKMADLLAVLPDPGAYLTQDARVSDQDFFDDTALGSAMASALPKLREATDDCPACIMAALRQKGIPLPVARDFDFKKEMEHVWAEVNERQREADACIAYCD
jgi:hypothetical protein